MTVATYDGEPLGSAPTRSWLERADGTWELHSGAHGRVSIDEVPIGDHRLLCVSGDERWWGLFAVEVFETGPLELRRALAPAR